MGKQKGDGNRTKNRPSSSTLAASLLQSGTTSVGFGGYVGSSHIEATLTKESTSLLDVDGEVAQHLRRLSKKDPVTKLKALASLCDLFRQSSVSDLCQIVPQWVFEYKRLVQDNSRQVRQAAHDAMANLAVTIGRGLAPHLRSVMGAWWLGQFDPYTEVAEAARRSFQGAFPVQEKRLEALVFCENEIFLYLDENLKLTPQTISDKSAPAEELEEVHQRVVSSSLLALASLLDVLLGPSLQRSTSENGSPALGLDIKNAAKAKSGAIAAADKICHTHKFFQEFLKSRNCRVRSAVYQVFVSFLKYTTQVFSEEDVKKLAGIVLGSFQEKDPICHSSMWDMLLLFTRRFPEAWKIASVHKVVLPRFWCFLRHGCYGSQQASYPCLLPMLASIPFATVIPAEQFFNDFFRNLWAGKSVSLASPADRDALFRAIKECFMWVLNNASRYVEEGSDRIEEFCIGLVESIIVKLLWLDYIRSGNSNMDNIVTDGSSVTKKIHDSKETIKDKPNFIYPKDFMQELRNCIIDFLSNLSTKFPNLLHAFGTHFQILCIEIINQVAYSALPEFNQHVDNLSDFFILLGTRSLNDRERWPLIHLARPFVATLFPVIKLKATPAAISLLSVIISVFGSSVLPIASFAFENGESHLQISSSYDQEPKPEHLLQFFKANIATWCLYGSDQSTSSRIDLLLSFLEDAYFQSHWDWLVGCAAGTENESVEIDDMCLNEDQITVLAILVEKVRVKFICQNILRKSNRILGFEANDWHSRRLDAISIAITRYNTVKFPTRVWFLRCVLGGTEQEDIVPLISKEAMNLVMKELLKQLAVMLMESPYVWATYAASLILPHGTERGTQTESSSSEDRLQVATFATEVLGCSFFSLKVLDGDFEVVPHILAASILNCWEGRMSKRSGLSCILMKLWELNVDARNLDEVDVGSQDSEGDNMDEYIVEHADEEDVPDGGHESEVAFAKSMQGLWCKITSFCKSFSFSSLQCLRWLLIESIRYGVFKESTGEVENVVTLCTKWMVELMGYTCKDQNEEQQMLDHLLSSSDAWPFWAEPPSVGESRPVTLKPAFLFSEADKDMHTRFIMFVEKIDSLLGKDKLFSGSLAKTSEITVDQMNNQTSSCRIWLAVEVLCTWRWPGGCAMQSLLPFLCEYAKTRPGHPKWIMVNSIINILFLGAMNNSAASTSYPLNPWVKSDDEVDKIEEPFLHALLMLLVVLFKDGNTWNKADASRILLDYIVKEEFLNVSVNIYVKILPHILNVLAPIVRQRTENLEDCNDDFSLGEKNTPNVQKAACQWLERAASGPPLILCQKEQSDVEEWINVAVSCFPLNHVGGISALKMASSAQISTQERELLLALFQKQLSQEAMSGYRALAAEHRALMDTVSTAVAYWEPSKEQTLARLMSIAIGYCWQGFREDEWAFVLAQLRKWLDAAVGSMEDLAEGINDAMKQIDPSASSEVDVTLEKVDNVVINSKIHSVELTEIGVFIFSLIYGLHNLDGAGLSSSLSSLKVVNWEKAEARTFENILRLFFATGIAESIASSSCAGKKAGAIVALSRQGTAHFWENVANVVIAAPSRAKEAAVHATELWGLSKRAISALYANLFSVYPIPALQWASYNFLSSDRIQPLAVTKGVLSVRLEESNVESEEADQTAVIDSSPEQLSIIRVELSDIMQTSSSELLESSLTADIRVQYLLAWSLFLTRLQAVPSLSAGRECMVQYAQDSGSLSTLLDCLFQHIRIKQGSSSGLKKHNTAAIEASVPGSAAQQSAATGSLSFAVEGLWPIGKDEMAALAGAVYGLMLRVLPASVRNWFTSLRKHSTLGFIEAFTMAWCSPRLLDDEFYKIQAAGIADESLTIRANRSEREVTASYKKEEAVLDVVIRLPLCYPLRPVEAECTRKIGVSESRLRKWILSMTSFIRNQNGAVSEAIQIWKRNIDREFEGVEECPICYSIIHTTHHTLPRLACKTCKHKYHSACLYKWFSTSHKSTCPLCQSPFVH